MKRKLMVIMIGALATNAASVHAEPGLFERLINMNFFTSAANDAPVVQLGDHQRGGGPQRGGGNEGGHQQQPPRQEPPRREPPRQEPPRQEPPRREPPRQEPPRQEPPRREPPRQEPPRQEPPRREPPRQEPPRQEPPRREPPRQEPPRQEPPRREPPRQQPPRREPPRQEPPRHEPPRQRPPVIVPPHDGQRGQPGQPGQPGHGGRVMPVPPRPIPGGAIDPRHHGDDHANQAPRNRWDGRPDNHREWQNQYGRRIPPGHDHITIINNTTIINNINGVHRGWNTNDHGYGWYDWGGNRMCHHYDTFGYHWWGFYVGNDYFWTRYYNDRYWWYDPYYGRWVYMHDGRWWWQDPLAPTVVYVIIDNNYYRYQDNAGTIVTRPDTTPPVVTPPAEPSVPSTPAPDQETMYSLDGTRSVQILGTAKEAYLYDLTATDQNGAAAGGKWLGTGVKSAKFVYDDKHESDGSTTQVVRQIELDYDDATIAAVVDANGERKIVITGTERSADLYDLTDANATPQYLASGVSEIKMVNGESVDGNGETVRSLKLVIVTAKDESGNDSLLMFNRDGAPYGTAAEPSAPAPSVVPSATERMHKSAAFNELLSGQLGW